MRQMGCVDRHTKAVGDAQGPLWGSPGGRDCRALSGVVLVYLMGQGMLVRSTAKGAHLATLDPPLKTRLAGC